MPEPLLGRGADPANRARPVSEATDQGIGRMRRCQPSGTGSPAPSPCARTVPGRGSPPLAGSSPAAVHPEQVVALAPLAEQHVAAAQDVARAHDRGAVRPPAGCSRRRRPARAGAGPRSGTAPGRPRPAGAPRRARRPAGRRRSVVVPARRRAGPRASGATSSRSAPNSTAEAASAAAVAAGPWTRSVSSRASRRWPSRAVGSAAERVGHRVGLLHRRAG